METHPDGSRKFEPWPCPGCGYVMDASADLTDDKAQPGEGDLSVCLRCALPFMLVAGRWRALTDDELLDLPFAIKQHLSRVQIMVRELNAMGLGPKDLE